MIDAVPADLPVTTPLEDTVATFSSLDFHVTVLSVAVEGETVAVSVSVEPVLIETLVVFNVTLSGFIGFTVTMQVAFAPFDKEAVIVVVPAFKADIIPFETVATFLLLESHVTVLFVTDEGETVAVSVSVPPTFSVMPVLFNDIVLLSFTVTLNDLVTLWFPAAFAVIVAVPGLAPVSVTAFPLVVVVVESFTTLALLVDHVIFLLVLFDGVNVAVTDAVPLIFIVEGVVLKLRLVGVTIGSTTVTVQVAVLPLTVLAVMVDCPADLPVTVMALPVVGEIVATPGLLDVQVTVLSFALLGFTVAVSVVVEPVFMVTLF